MAEAMSLPSTYEAMYQRATYLASQGNLVAAAGLLRRIVNRLSSLSDETLSRQHGLALFGLQVGRQLATILSATGSYDESVAVLRDLVRFGPEEDDALARHMAVVRLAQGQLDEARQIMLPLTERFTYDPGHWLVLGQIEFSDAHYPEAEAAFKRAIEVTANQEDAGTIWYYLFQLHAEQGQVDQALAAWERTASLDQELADSLARELYSFLLRQGEVTKLRRYLDNDASPLRVEFYRGLLLQREGNFGEGRRHWERLLEMDPTESPYGLLEFAEAALRLSDIRKATVVLLAGSEEVQSPHGFLLLAIAAAKAGRLDEAKRLLQTGTLGLAAHTPRRSHYSRADWEMLTSLVDNRTFWAELQPFFAVAEAS
ncbi:MAG: tetratricopeptide repeat protein [Anaerolineae bacterium]